MKKIILKNTLIFYVRKYFRLLLFFFSSCSFVSPLTIELINTNYLNNENYLSSFSSIGENDDFKIWYTVDSNTTYQLEIYDAGRVQNFGVVATNNSSGGDFFVFSGSVLGSPLLDGTYTFSIKPTSDSYSKSWVYPRDSSDLLSGEGRWKYFQPRDIAINTNGWVFVLFYGNDLSSVNQNVMFNKIWVITNTVDFTNIDFSDVFRNGFWITPANISTTFSFSSQTPDNDSVKKMVFHTNNDMYVIDQDHIYWHNSFSNWDQGWSNLFTDGGNDLASMTLDRQVPPNIYFTYRASSPGKIFSLLPDGSLGATLDLTTALDSSSDYIRSLQLATNGYFFGQTYSGKIFKVKTNDSANIITYTLSRQYAMDIPDFGSYENVYFQDGVGTLKYYPVSVSNFASNENTILRTIADSQGKGSIYGYTAMASFFDKSEKKGTFILAGYNHYRLDRYALDGSYIDAKEYSKKRLYEPSQVTINPVNGHLYVTDYVYDKVMVLSADGDFITEFGLTGYSEFSFINPRGITCDDEGLIYVVDYSGSRILVFRDENETISFVNEKQTGKRYWSLSYNRANKLFYATVYGSATKVVILDLLGDSDSIENGGIGSYGNLDNNNELKFYYAYDVAIFGSDQIVVADYYNRELQMFGENDLYSITTPNENATYFRSVCFNSEGDLFSIAVSGNFNVDGTLIKYQNPSINDFSNKTLLFTGADGADLIDLVVDAAQDVFVTRQNRTIEKWSSTSAIAYGRFYIDNTYPIAKITYPLDGGKLGGKILVTGSAYDKNLKSYYIYYMKENDATKYPIKESQVGVTNGVLGSFEPSALENTLLTIYLEVEDKAGNKITHNVTSLYNASLAPNFIIASNGGVASNKMLSAVIPPNAFESDGNFIISIDNELLSGVQGFLKPVSDVYSIVVDTYQNIIAPISYQLKYDFLTPQTIYRLVNLSNVYLYRYDRSSYSFEKVETNSYRIDYKNTNFSFSKIAPDTYVLLEEIDFKKDLLISQIKLFPNPVVDDTFYFYFTLNKKANVTFSIYSMQGDLISTLVDEQLDAGFYQDFSWNLKNNNNRSVPNGVYLLKIEVSDGEKTSINTKKIIVLN